ncbi:AMP-binding protein [Xanthobacter dioxanivorans]|uniref:AMP-binding protein n=1 Tax=Xanthobacter dioxanivorans TaxID=2528964 RepID=A0A974SIA2_9HYPH|nr:AMP-binding protein [Xanthobacter dioxanivorans]QRG06232.1 AMP-binding protein [Xanthobacter dioxanivorans]
MNTLRPPIGVRQPMPGVTYPPLPDLKRHLASGVLEARTLIAALRASFDRNKERVALVGDGWSMTFGTLDMLSDRAALAFAKLGLRPLDRVVFQVGNGANLVVAILGCLKAGLIPVCTLHVHREVEIVGLGTHAEARAHFIDTTPSNFDFHDFAARMRTRVPTLQWTVAVNGNGSALVPTLAELIAAADAEEARAFVRQNVAALDPFQVAVFQISGGSTGLPKIIPRFQNDYLANMLEVTRATAMSADDCVVTPGPMLHNAGLVCFWGPALLAGARVGILEKIQDAELSRLFSACCPTWLYMPKPLLPRLVKVLAQHPEARARMRGIVTSSSGSQIEQEIGVRTQHFYGMTEGIISYTRADDPPGIRHQTIGWPIAEGDEVRILRPGTEEAVAPGEVGEVVFRGPYVFHGYYNAPEQNRVSFTSDGWVRSGDLAHEVLRENRRALVFDGRLKDLISRGGEKISCEEVERYARSHPAILDIVIVPVPDPVYGERGCAFVIPDTSHPCPDVGDLGRHLAEQGLAKFKWPEHVFAIDAFPTTSAGKLDKQALRGRAAQLVGGAS